MNTLKSLIFPAFVMATEAAMAHSAMAGSATAIFEVAVYSVNDKARFETVHQAALSNISKEAGFLDNIALKNADGSLYADIVVWNNLDAAGAAAEKVGTLDDFKSFREGISGITLFRHYAASYLKTQFDHYHQAGKMLEIAASQMASISVQETASQPVYDALQSKEGFNTHLSLMPVGDDQKSHIDFISWDSVEAAKAAGEAIMGNPSNAAFFENAETMELFEFFQAWGSRFNN